MNIQELSPYDLGRVIIDKVQEVTESVYDPKILHLDGETHFRVVRYLHESQAGEIPVDDNGNKPKPTVEIKQYSMSPQRFALVSTSDEPEKYRDLFSLEEVVFDPIKGIVTSL